MRISCRYWMGGLLIASLTASGCSRSAPEPVAKGEPVLVPVLNTPEKVATPAPIATTPPTVVTPPPVPFRIPSDTGGRAVTKVLTPAPVTPNPIPSRNSPIPREPSAIDRGDLPEPNVSFAVPTIPFVEVKSPQPTPPPERVPTDIGQQLGVNPSTLPLPEPLITIPEAVQPMPRIPDLPRLARQVPDRASVINPTADITTARLLLVRVFPMLGTSSFTRFGVPDPFEFAKHLKDKSIKTPEVATQPAPSHPHGLNTTYRRVKGCDDDT